MATEGDIGTPDRKRRRIIRLYPSSKATERSFSQPSPSSLTPPPSHNRAPSGISPAASAPPGLPAALDGQDLGRQNARGLSPSLGALDEDDELVADLPSDTLLALQLLQKQFPPAAMAECGLPPIMLRSQVYSLVEDHTIVDRELDELRRQHVIRVFRAPIGRDEYAYMMTNDYVTMLTQLQCEHKAKGGQHPEAFSLFAGAVLPQCREVSIAKSELLLLLSKGLRPAVRAGDALLAPLLTAGLLTQHLVDRERLWFAMGNFGPLARSLQGGRKELLGLVRRGKYPEMFAKELAAKKLRSTRLDVRFLVRDLVGAGTLLQMDTPSGQLLRIAKKGV